MKKTVYLICSWSLDLPIEHYLYYDRKSALKQLRSLLSDPSVNHISFDKEIMEVEK